jgi:hypothetical protein
MLSVIMLNVTNKKPFMLNVIMLSVIMLSGFLLSVVILSVIILSDIVLNATYTPFMRNVIMQSVMVPNFYGLKKQSLLSFFQNWLSLRHLFSKFSNLHLYKNLSSFMAQ